jgi:hypothetical protein
MTFWTKEQRCAQCWQSMSRLLLYEPTYSGLLFAPNRSGGGRSMAEEKACGQKLNSIAESMVNPKAAHAHA